MPEEQNVHATQNETATIVTPGPDVQTSTATPPQSAAGSDPGAVVGEYQDTNQLLDAFMSGKLNLPKGDQMVRDESVIPSQNEETFEQQQARLNGEGTHTAQTIQQAAQPQSPAQQTMAAATASAGFKYVKPLPIEAARDYTGLTPDEVFMFKNMNNKSYATLRPLYDYHKKHETEWDQTQAQLKEYKEVNEKLKNQHFYDIEGAWQLDPEIQPKLAEANQFAQEADFWQTQLANIDAGKPVQLLVLGADGKPTLTAPREPAPEDRAVITRQMQQAIMLHQNANAEAQKAVQNFKANYQAYNNEVESVRARVLGPFEKIIAPNRDAMLKNFPVMIRHKPEVKALADMTIVMGKLLNDLAEYKKREKAGTLLAPAMASASPRQSAPMTQAGDTSAVAPLDAAKKMMRMVGRG